MVLCHFTFFKFDALLGIKMYIIVYIKCNTGYVYEKESSEHHWTGNLCPGGKHKINMPFIVETDCCGLQKGYHAKHAMVAH